MIKVISSLTVLTLLAGGVLIGTVEPVEADKPNTIKVSVEEQTDAALPGTEAPTQTVPKQTKPINKTQNNTEKAARSVTPEAVTPTVPTHQHEWTAQYKTEKVQTGTEAVIHKYCYKCKSDITGENIEEHLNGCRTDMYTTKTINEPVYDEVQTVDFWKCECGEVKE